VIAERQEADGSAEQAQGDFPRLSVPAGGGGDREDPPDSARWGEILGDRTFRAVLLLDPILGRNEDAASSGPSVPASRLGLEAVEPGMALRYMGTLCGVPRIVSAIGLGSRSGGIGRISLDAKCAGARSAGNPPATCEVAGAGNRLTVRLVRHSQGKRGAMDVRPAKAGMFSGRQSHRGKSQKPRSLGCIRGGNEADEAD